MESTVKLAKLFVDSFQIVVKVSLITELSEVLIHFTTGSGKPTEEQDKLPRVSFVPGISKTFEAYPVITGGSGAPLQ